MLNRILMDAMKELVWDNGRHYFDVTLVARHADVSVDAVQQAAYRLAQNGKLLVIPNVPEQDDAYKITSIALDTSILV